MMPNSTRIQPSAVHIVAITPSLDCATTPRRRTLGEEVAVSAHVVGTSPLVVKAAVRYRSISQKNWERATLVPDPNDVDRFRGAFEVDALGRWQYQVEAWIDRAATWRDELRRRLESDQADLEEELASGNKRFGTTFTSVEEALASTLEDREGTVHSSSFVVDVDPERARFSAWYELFPRSFGGFEGVRSNLARLAELGFDVLYLPPVHPIGRTNRKGRNNALTARDEDPGSPWAIGDRTGGHTAIHPDLGTFEEFDLLVEEARVHGIEVAMDLAFQCSVDHPWLREHPEWFSWREDGTVRFAENPPKRYEDIVNFNFESLQWWELWNALHSIVSFWIGHGVRIFRVDNPHTKPLPFWEWLIQEVRTDHPDVFFLSEAFTRPALMDALAKAGFSQSYTYFTWRNTREELTTYLGELADERHEYLRPNFFVNTPDILSAYLQNGGPAAFSARAVLAATLSPAYGVYSGFENFENDALREDSEEYLNSEKYEVKHRHLDGPLLTLFGRLNEIRHSSSVFKHLDNIRFLPTANDQLIAYLKGQESHGYAFEIFVVCVNLNPHFAVEGRVDIPSNLGLPNQFTAIDVLHDASYLWNLGGNFVRLEPGASHVLRIR